MPKTIGRSTKRLVVRPYAARDHAAWKASWSALPEPKNTWDRRRRKDSELTAARFQKLLGGQRERRKDDSYYDLGVFRKPDGALIGEVSLMNVSRGVFQSAYLGYFIFNAHWGRGYGKEAVRACLDIGFRDLRLHRIEAGIERNNVRSLKLARSLKMRREGTKKRCLYFGKWVDIGIFTLTTEDVGLRFKGPIPRLSPRS